jgi:peroxiredoxin
MKRYIFAVVTLAMFMVACGGEFGGANTTISGRFVGSGVDSVFLERVADNFATSERVDGVALQDNGGFSFAISLDETSPRFYKLTFGANSRPVTLVVAAGDDIKLEAAGDIFLNYTVEGSEESALIREFNRDYFTPCDQLALIAERLHTDSRYTGVEAYRAAQQAMKAQVRFVGTNMQSLAAVYALRHAVAEQYIPQLDGYGVTLAHYNAVLEGLKVKYPDSPYIAVLEQDIAEQEAVIDVLNKVEIASYPDIELQDMYRKKHRLASLSGGVTLLYFWISESALCNNINAELKELYERYHDKGFEVYHVSADADEAVWIDAVRQQRHPWISVYGGMSADVFTLFGVETLPKAYIIDREGNVSVAPLAMDILEREIKRCL